MTVPNHRRMSLAHHEAAHVAVGYEFGWWLGRRGVNIDGWPCAWMDYTDAAHTTRACLCFSMAGWLAEEKFYGVPGAFKPDDIVNHWQALCAGQPEAKHPADPRGADTDLRKIALELYDDDMTDDTIRQAVTYWRGETWALLESPRVWAGVQRVAKLLLRRGHLGRRAAERALGESFFNR